MLDQIRADFAIIRERDPAARGPLEILLCYPGFQAISMKYVLIVCLLYTSDAADE